MKIGVIGSGMVGQTLAKGARAKGHDVVLGTRDPSKLAAWQAGDGAGVRVASVADAAAHGELVLLATKWEGTEAAVKAAGRGLDGKVLVDVTNPLKIGARGPELAVGFTTSAGEMVQAWAPQARVVKAFNTITAAMMIDATLLGDTPTMFIAGNDAAAKQAVTQLLHAFRWADVVDLGAIEQSRLLEPLAMVWIKYYIDTKSWKHAVKLIRG
jgi:hypothetical protein